MPYEAWDEEFIEALLNKAWDEEGINDLPEEAERLYLMRSGMKKIQRRCPSSPARLE